MYFYTALFKLPKLRIFFYFSKYCILAEVIIIGILIFANVMSKMHIASYLLAWVFQVETDRWWYPKYPIGTQLVLSVYNMASSKRFKICFLFSYHKLFVQTHDGFISYLITNICIVWNSKILLYKTCLLQFYNKFTNKQSLYIYFFIYLYVKMCVYFMHK